MRNRVRGEYKYGNVQPRQLVMQALSLPDWPFSLKTRQGKQEKATREKEIEPTLYEGSIVAREDGGLSEESYTLKNPMNSACPADVGLGAEAYENDFVPSQSFSLNGKSRFFQLDQKRWYWTNMGFPDSAFCEGNGVYFIRNYTCGREKCLKLEQRVFENFQKTWEGIISFSGAASESFRSGPLGLLSLSRDGETLNLRLIYRDSGQVFTVRATPTQ